MIYFKRLTAITYRVFSNLEINLNVLISIGKRLQTAEQFHLKTDNLIHIILGEHLVRQSSELLFLYIFKS